MFGTDFQKNFIQARTFCLCRHQTDLVHTYGTIPLLKELCYVISFCISKTHGGTVFAISLENKIESKIVARLNILISPFPFNLWVLILASAYQSILSQNGWVIGFISSHLLLLLFMRRFALSAQIIFHLIRWKWLWMNLRFINNAKWNGSITNQVSYSWCHLVWRCIKSDVRLHLFHYRTLSFKFCTANPIRSSQFAHFNLSDTLYSVSYYCITL